MSILLDIKKASFEARKTKQPAAVFLTTLFAEAQSVGKTKRNGESTDEEVIGVLKRFKAGAETIIQSALEQNAPDAQSKIDRAQNELEWINNFLPQMLVEADLRKLIGEYITQSQIVDVSGMGKIMNRLKLDYPGLYDGALASRIVKEMLIS